MRARLKRLLRDAGLGDTDGILRWGQNGGWTRGAGTTVPTDGTAGWAPGAVFIDTDASENAQVYRNVGTKTSCNFDLLGETAGEIAIVDSAANFTGTNMEAALAECVTKANAQTITGAKTFEHQTLKVNDTGDDHAITIEAAADEGSARTLLIPALGGNDTLSCIGQAETFSAAKTLSPGAAAAAVALRLGADGTEGLEFKVIDETVALTNAVETDLTETIPAGAVILSSQGNAEVAIDGDDSGDDGFVDIGIGTTADPDKYGKTSANADPVPQNTKIDNIPDWAVLSSEETVTVKACDANGAAVTEKFAGSQNFRVRIVYAVCNSLADA